MSNQIVPFEFGAHQVRVIQAHGEPWFVLADICKVLDLSNPTRVAERVDADALTTAQVIDSLGRSQSATVVSEAGMYQVIFMSRKEEAAAFRRWITNEVIPAIRKTGSYSAPKSLEQRSLELITDLNTEVVKLTTQIERDAPKVDYVDTYVADGDLRLLRNVAKSIDMTESVLRADLLDRKWIYTEHTTRWSETKQAKETITRYSPYSHKAQYFEPVPNHLAPRFKGEVMHTLKVTPQGAVAIARLYGKHLQLVGDVA